MPLLLRGGHPDPFEEGGGHPNPSEVGGGHPSPSEEGGGHLIVSLRCLVYLLARFLSDVLIMMKRLQYYSSHLKPLRQL